MSQTLLKMENNFHKAGGGLAWLGFFYQKVCYNNLSMLYRKSVQQCLSSSFFAHRPIVPVFILYNCKWFDSSETEKNVKYFAKT